MLRLLVVLAAALLARGAPPGGLAQDATPAAAPAALRLAEQRRVEIDGGQPLALSPDGRRLAAWREAGAGLEVCAFATATLAAERCAPFPGSSVGADSVAWSPDGTRFAFTEDDRFDEADLWVLDVDAGTVANLTADGQADLFPTPPGTPLDLAPAWSPDGTEIVVARSLQEGETEEDEVETTALHVVAADGGEPREVLRVAEERFVVRAGVRWLADGTVLYSVAVPSGDPTNGLWAVDAAGGAAGGEPRQLVNAAEAGLEVAVLVAVSARGQALLLTPGGPPAFTLVDLATGQAEPLEQADPAAGPVAAAAFSPDGTRLLFVAAGDGFGRLVVRELATGAEQELGELDEPVGAADYRSGLAWAANDLAFGPSAARTGVLLRLAAG